jgi:hypothetical protein
MPGLPGNAMFDLQACIHLKEEELFTVRVIEKFDRAGGTIVKLARAFLRFSRGEPARSNSVLAPVFPR